ncbi:MAG: cytochrome c3 family protein [Deltaproteobacteria bacterium]|nr:cytochrome c3 family protein [Deltaproteobacteria bacterium]
MRLKTLWAALFILPLLLVAVRMDPSPQLRWEPALAGAEKSNKSATSSNSDVIIINNDDYKSKRRGPVTFTHLKHAKEYGVSCWECHHEFEDNLNIWVPWSDTGRCADCHDPKGDEEMVGLQKAYHANCRDCHRVLDKQNKKTGPARGCFGCHEKEQK